MDVDTILFDWGWTLARVSNEMEALTAGAAGVVHILTGKDDPVLAENLIAEAMAAEVRAGKDPQAREVDLFSLLEKWAGSFDPSISVDKFQQAVEAVGEHWIGRALVPIPGAVETLQELKRRGYRLGLISNVFIPPVYCRRELELQGFAALLDFAVFSSEIGYRKPSPLIYEAALANLFSDGQSRDLSRILFVGDSPPYDVMAPARLGMKTGLILCRNGLWTDNDYDAARPDLRMDLVTELPGLLL